jgi:hypothetical protein
VDGSGNLVPDVNPFKFGRTQNRIAQLTDVGMRADNVWSQAQPNGFGGFPTSARPDPRFTTQQIIDNLNESRYRALQLTTKRRFASGTAPFCDTHQFLKSIGFKLIRSRSASTVWAEAPAQR